MKKGPADTAIKNMKDKINQRLKRTLCILKIVGSTCLLSHPFWSKLCEIVIIVHLKSLSLVSIQNYPHQGKLKNYCQLTIQNYFPLP